MGAKARAGDGVLGGAGSVDGRPVFCYAQDASFAGGSLGEAHADTITLRLADGMPSGRASWFGLGRSRICTKAPSPFAAGRATALTRRRGGCASSRSPEQGREGSPPGPAVTGRARA